jgi:hypothetical protein
MGGLHGYGSRRSRGLSFGRLQWIARPLTSWIAD